MALTLHGRNNVVYRNETQESQTVSLELSGRANLHLRRPGATTVRTEAIPDGGGALSLDVAPAHYIEIDVRGEAALTLTFIGVKRPD